MVRDLETRNLERLGRKSLPPQAREILLLAASIHLREGKGLTVKHLQRSGFEKDNAEKVIQDARRNGLLVPGERREGKQKQYYEANYKHKIDAKSSNKRSKDALVPIDKDIVFHLLRLLSNRKYVYHNIHLETSLNYVKEDYKSINWYITSPKNKQKKFEFKLNSNRNCSIVLSPTGTVNISIKCSSEPYEFHTPSGSIEFISSCGQALNEIRHGANNRLEVVPSIHKWYISQFDYNKDIPSSLSKNRDPEVLSWSSICAYGRLQIEHLGTIFQIYPKGLPDKEDYTRFEGHYFERRTTIRI